MSIATCVNLFILRCSATVCTLTPIIVGEAPRNTTVIDYYPVINHPITDNKAVQECLRVSEEASHEVGQKYIITTFDLGVCMRAFPLMWNRPEQYKYHIVMLGSFHVICAFLKALGKKMCGSGIADIFIEAGLITSGCINGVMSGKHYNRAILCHKTMAEALERLLFQKFVELEDSSLVHQNGESMNVFEAVISNLEKESYLELLINPKFQRFMSSYQDFRDKVASGLLGKTAQFWVSYLDNVWLVLSYIRAVKVNDLPLYAHCLFKMSDLFFAFDCQNYARYGTFFSVFLVNVETSHPGATRLLVGGAFSVARSHIHGNRCAVDKTIEETFMRQSKSRGGMGGSGTGLSGLENNQNEYQRWVRSLHQRTKYVDAALAMAGMATDTSNTQYRRETRKHEIDKSEKRTRETMVAITSFLNPFEIPEKDQLFCLSSGSPVNSEIEAIILSAPKIGEDAKEAFVKERLMQNIDFSVPIKRSNLKSFDTQSKRIKISTMSNKVVTLQQQSSIALQLLIKSDEDIPALMQYPLCSVPFSLGTPDGHLAKNNKATGMSYIIKDALTLNSYPSKEDKLIVIQDGNALYHTIREVPGTFKDICYKIFDMLPKQVDIIFSTDMYNTGSIKSSER